MNILSKYEGAGNDFIIIDDRNLDFDQTQISRLCHRKFGVGADGLVLLQRSDRADFRMRIFNCNGMEAETCGNALRCLGRFIVDLGFPEKPYSIETLEQVAQISYLDDLIAVNMGKARSLQLHIATERGIIHSIDTGVPHAVYFVEDVNTVSFAEIALYFRHHPFFSEKGTNVNFAALQTDGSIQVRTFERGVEAETLACGTGACAVAAVASHIHGLKGPTNIVFPGGVLQVAIDQDQITLIGPATRIFSGASFSNKNHADLQLVSR